MARLYRRRALRQRRPDEHIVFRDQSFARLGATSLMPTCSTPWSSDAISVAWRAGQQRLGWSRLMHSSAGPRVFTAKEPGCSRKWARGASSGQLKHAER